MSFRMISRSTMFRFRFLFRYRRRMRAVRPLVMQCRCHHELRLVFHNSLKRQQFFLSFAAHIGLWPAVGNEFSLFRDSGALTCPASVRERPRTRRRVVAFERVPRGWREGDKRIEVRP